MQANETQERLARFASTDSHHYGGLASTLTAFGSTTAPSHDSRLSALLQRFDPIRLSEMRGVALLRRADTKYLMTEDQLAWALAYLAGDYRVLEIAGRRLHHYQTLYFDTPDLALYRQHHSGMRDRYKVRERAYTDSDLVFLEIKHKVGAHTTHKSRVRMQELSVEIATGVEPFLRRHYPYPVEGLEPTLLNTFQRITLVSRRNVERLTLDIAVRFWWSGAHGALDGIAIAELKQDGFSFDSEFVRHMRALGVRPGPFSKYCTGISLLYPGVKTNRFKPRLRRIEKLMQGGSDVHRTH